MISLPIYYADRNKTTLIGLNWYRNAHHYEQNKVKKHYHDLITASVLPSPITGTYRLEILVYYKNPASDGANIAEMFEKFVLDSFQTLGVTQQDNVKHHLGTTWSVGGQDKENPRVEITLIPTQGL